jgi:hypothetical protein
MMATASTDRPGMRRSDSQSAWKRDRVKLDVASVSWCLPNVCAMGIFVA